MNYHDPSCSELDSSYRVPLTIISDVVHKPDARCHIVVMTTITLAPEQFINRDTGTMEEA